MLELEGQEELEVCPLSLDEVIRFCAPILDEEPVDILDFFFLWTVVHLLTGASVLETEGVSLPAMPSRGVQSEVGWPKAL